MIAHTPKIVIFNTLKLLGVECRPVEPHQFSRTGPFINYVLVLHKGYTRDIFLGLFGRNGPSRNFQFPKNLPGVVVCVCGGA